ncbi:MAG: hypothetical protein Q9213_001048 [Squamulea squamosa]
MRLSLADYVLSSVLLALIFASPLNLRRRQYLNGSPEYYVANANVTAVGSANELNQDTQPLPQINSTYLPAALTKALHLNFTDAISRFHPNGTYKNTLELPDIDSNNFTGCRYWPQLGQRIQIQVFKWFTSKTSTSELSFWVHDPSHGFYEHCINNALPGWNLLQTYVMSPCLNDNITWELQDTDASTLVIREYIECRGGFSWSPSKPLAPSGYRSTGSQMTGLTGPGKKRKREVSPLLGLGDVRRVLTEQILGGRNMTGDQRV